MTVYIDGDYKCHAAAADGLTAIDHSFFDGKCTAFIKTYRLVPEGHTWVRDDGAVFRGEMIAPHTDIAPALAIQQEYDAMSENAADYVAAYEEGVASAWE